MELFINMFKALSDKTRVRVMALLIQCGKELCICELMDALQLPHYNVSRHMRELKMAGFVQERKEGKFMFYSLVKPKDNFHKYIINALGLIKDSADKKHLKKRLALRQKGKCVIGIRNCC